MKILLANYRYFVSGGPERYLFNLSDLLNKSQHEIIPFSVKYKKNIESDFSDYFVSPIDSDQEIYYEQQKKSPIVLFRTLSRNFYSKEVERSILNLIDDTSPDIAYVLHYLRKLSPSLLVGMKKRGLPVVVRLSDFAMVCPQAHCVYGQSPCTLCVQGNLLNSVKYKCVKNSYLASLINYFATTYHNYKNYFSCIDKFIVTNPFMYKIMIDSGYEKDRLIIIPTFTNIEKYNSTSEKKDKHNIIFSGRLDHLKGLHVLLEAFVILKNQGTKARLVIAGTGHSEYLRFCKKILSEGKCLDSVEFVGMVDADELSELYRGALFSVVPSLWFENLPNSLLESYASGVPVVASDIGSLSDAVVDNVTGSLFEPGNPRDLATKMDSLLRNRELINEMSISARQEAVQRYSFDSHVASLLDVFNALINEKRPWKPV